MFSKRKEETKGKKRQKSKRQAASPMYEAEVKSDVHPDSVYSTDAAIRTTAARVLLQ